MADPLEKQQPNALQHENIANVQHNLDVFKEPRRPAFIPSFLITTQLIAMLYIFFISTKTRTTTLKKSYFPEAAALLNASDIALLARKFY